MTHVPRGTCPKYRLEYFINPRDHEQLTARFEAHLASPHDENESRLGGTSRNIIQTTEYQDIGKVKFEG